MKKCSKHNLELKLGYSYWPEKKTHRVCSKCIHELIAADGKRLKKLREALSKEQGGNNG